MAFKKQETPEEEAAEHDVSIRAARKMMRSGRRGKRKVRRRSKR